MTNISAAKCNPLEWHFINITIALADVVRTSLGPRGMDKMI